MGRQNKLMGDKSRQNMTSNSFNLQVLGFNLSWTRISKTNHTSLVGSAWSPGQCTLNRYPLNSSVHLCGASVFTCFLCRHLGGRGQSLCSGSPRERTVGTLIAQYAEAMCTSSVEQCLAELNQAWARDFLSPLGVITGLC